MPAGSSRPRSARAWRDASSAPAAWPAPCCTGWPRDGAARPRGQHRSRGDAAPVAQLARAGIRVSLFIDPEERQIEAAAEVRAPVIELHTGAYAHAAGPQQALQLTRLDAAVRRARALGLTVHAGHGLDYHNVQPV